MNYDFRTREGQSYDPNYSRPAAAAVSSSAHPPYGKPSSLYPKIGGGGASSSTPGVPGRGHQFQHAPAPPSTSGIGITVAVKPEYKITPPPQLSPHVGEIPRSRFHFDFEFERILLAEAIKENPNWNRLGLETVPPKPTESTSYNPSADHLVSKYIASGLNREAVPIAVANYGDNPAKVKEFVNGYALLHEMGFSSNSVADALFMYDNDTDKALAHFLNGAS
ncbi:Ubiquitin-associated 1 [Olea europaea subsp. europaea]|uniref:Ubiquitin-associated 1 n=1 Tax=Olea europaea subsp. europaea TaxID=158383 RepID=A0A8S0STV0_OLEEU|nr:Ubiquitin-associated 1 [Olea europaea subsp. europaea]